MKRLYFITLLLVTAFTISGQAQDTEFTSTRLDNYANQLKRSTVDLVDRTSEDMRRNSSNTRSDIDAAFLAHQLDASAGLFQQMIRDNRRAAELRDAAGILTDLARRAPNSGSNSYLWRNVQNSINDINRELGGGGGGNDEPNRPTSGRVYWRGMVDDRVQLVVQDRGIETRTIAGRAYPDGTYSFTSALPNRRVFVDVNKTRGRGNVRVIQQPSRNNDWTAIVEIQDTEGGAKEYQLEIFWR